MGEQRQAFHKQKKHNARQRQQGTSGHAGKTVLDDFFLEIGSAHGFLPQWRGL